MAANGTALDAGQASLVRQMCTSGARLQLAIAPAGAGKTTAMRALTLAWTQDGGQVIGLAPSAAAAAVLAEQTGIRTDTLAKLTWSLQHGDLPDWAAAVGPSTLVIIDEAGMADTLSLDTAVQFAIGRGASVRLIGDDQQLAAIGAGGVLRDIKHTHGALRLTELHRFTDPAEAAASLALRDGDPRRSTSTLITAGSMSATSPPPPRMPSPLGLPTERPGSTRSCSPPPANWSPTSTARPRASPRSHPCASEVRLADGNQASVGDVIITRSNDRRLRLTATDWVKNGDRWTITHRQQGRPDRPAQPQPPHRPAARRLRPRLDRSRLRHHHPRRPRRLRRHHARPATGQESRQQLYTMLTRGRAANHLYLQVVGDGDPHTVIRPDTVAPRTPTEILQQILARDDTPASATTLLRELSDPAARLFEAVQRYTDGLHVAAEQLVGPQIVQMLDAKPTRSSPNSPTSRRGRPSEHTSSRWRLRPVSTHSSTCTQPPPDENSTPQETWPPYWTGASQSPHPPTRGRCPGFPAFRSPS